MKKILLSFIAFFAMTLCAVAQVNLLENGDFEKWTDGQPDNWATASTVGNATLSQSEDAHGGMYAVRAAVAGSNKRLAYKETELEAGTYQMAFYAKGSKLKAGYTPVEAGKVGTYVYTENNIELSDTEWTLVEYEFTLKEKTTVCLVVMVPKNTADLIIDDFSLVLKEDGGETPEVPADPEVEGIAALKASDKGDYTLVLTDAIVTYVSGSNAYIQDANAGIAIYSGAHGLAAGQKLNGKVAVTLGEYGKAPQLTKLDASAATVTDGAEIPVLVLTAAEIAADVAKYDAMRVKVVEATLTADFGTGRNATIEQNGTSLALYKKDKNETFTAVAGDIVDVVGYPGTYNGALQLNVWEASDIVKTGEGGGETPEVPEVKEVDGIAAVKAAGAGDYVLNLTDAVVTYVNGNNAYIQDAEAGILVYMSGHGLEAGQKINGKVNVTFELYISTPELTKFDTSAATIVEGAEIPVLTLTTSELYANVDKYDAMRVKIVGATLMADFESRLATVEQNGAALGMYMKDKNAAFNLEVNKAYDIVGYPGYYKDAPVINVWLPADVTENLTVGISAVEQNNGTSAKVYTIDGRLVKRLVSGLYIINGKKVYVK